MEQRDYLKDQIDQLGKVLGMLIARLIGTKPGEASEQTVAAIQQDVSERTAIPFTELLERPPKELIPRLRQNPAFSPDNLEQMANLLAEMGKLKASEDEKASRKYLAQALAIYEYLSDHSRTFSLHWLDKMDALKKRLG